MMPLSRSASACGQRYRGEVVCAGHWCNRNHFCLRPPPQNGFPASPKDYVFLAARGNPKTTLTEIKTANQRTKNYKPNCAVQAILFGMVKRRMGGPVTGDQRKLRSNPNLSAADSSSSGNEAMCGCGVDQGALGKKHLVRFLGSLSGDDN